MRYHTNNHTAKTAATLSSYGPLPGPMDQHGCGVFGTCGPASCSFGCRAAVLFGGCGA